MVLLKKLLNNLAFHSTAILSSEEGEKHPRDFDILLSLGILKQDTFPQERLCPSCESEFVPIQVVSKDRAFTLCTINEEVGRDYFNPQTLKQWYFDTPSFISLFLKALDAKQPRITEKIEGLLWDLGTHKINGKQFHLLFAKSVNDADVSKHPIITGTPNAVVFYLGVANTALPNSVLLVPVLDIIKDLKNEGFVIDHGTLNSYLKTKITSPSKRELRKKIRNIIKNGKFSKKEKAFLKFLEKDFQPITIEEVSKEINTPTINACSNLKSRVKRKLKGTNFDIKLDKGGWGRKATYKLVYLLSSENSR